MDGCWKLIRSDCFFGLKRTQVDDAKLCRKIGMFNACLKYSSIRMLLLGKLSSLMRVVYNLINFL